MMEIITIGFIVLIFFAAIIAFRIIKNVLKTVLLVMMLITMVGIISGFYVAQDVNDLRENFFIQEKTFLITDQNQFVTGFRATEFDLENITFIPGTELSRLQGLYAEKDYKSMLGKSYKLIILKKELFKDAAEEAITNQTVSRGPLLIFSGYKEGKITVYPETPLFRAVRLLMVSAEKAKEFITRK